MSQQSVSRSGRPPVLERNAARSREAILDAAERLFAQAGYEATSLTDVGQHAGVSRGTPGYFFGSKADLWHAVLERCFREARDAVVAGRDRALASREPPDVVLGGVVRDYFDFLSAWPNFVRLMERQALGEGPEAYPDVARAAGQASLAAIVAELGLDDGRSREAAHLLLSMVALCWFPLVHGKTYLPAIGLAPESAGFAEERKAHVVDLILHGIAGRLGSNRARAGEREPAHLERRKASEQDSTS
ncbi:MAG TPA: TetR/AcrR family transcriptional regulator [Gemmatimonadales bacterium]